MLISIALAGAATLSWKALRECARRKRIRYEHQSHACHLMQAVMSGVRPERWPETSAVVRLN
jgi:hypothetical protein